MKQVFFKNFTFLALFFTLFSGKLLAVTGEDLNYTGYFRSGVGQNSKGGDHQCFKNPGTTPGNEFRLGNECGAYGELQLDAHHLRPNKNNGKGFSSVMQLSYSSDMH